jgi:ABC-type nitrate/sulfonate/bicarbonate transport system substrate-binding protein/outer membrane protein OmpA-like peptidoglycan-associated protein
MMTKLWRVGAAGLVGALALAVLPAVVWSQDKDKPAESPDGKPLTTADKYTYVPAESLPEVHGSGYDKADFDKNKIVKFPINIWIGWAPIIAANNGLAPNKDSVFFKKHGFQVELQVIDDPSSALAAFASGKTHIFWGTLDMMVLQAQQLSKDSRTSLRIFQQIDWSNGGDGIVARNGIKTINDLKPKNGKKRVITLAQYSPSHYYILTLLNYAGINPDEVEFKFVQDAFQAAKAFVSEKSIDACVTWSPDIYNISDPKRSGMKDVTLISSTKDAKRVIADVWAARADFANDHPEVIEGLVSGIFEGMDMLKKDQDGVAKLVEAAYKLNPGEAKDMFGDAHQTNWAENFEFFFNAKNPTNFESTWNAIADVYGKAHLIDPANVPAFSKVMDARVVEAVAGDFKHQKNEYADEVKKVEPPKPGEAPKAKTEILTRVVRIHFAPNIAAVDAAYDPNADKIVEEVGRMAHQFGGSTIVIQGHCDRSKYDEAKALGLTYLKKHSEKVKQLSQERAQGVVDAILAKFPDFKKEPDKFVAEGMGWEKPLASDALSRRVEIRVLSPE